MGRIYLILLLSLSTLVSCNDIFDSFLTEEPETVVSNTNFWKSEKDVQATVDELHAAFRSLFGSAKTRLYMDRGLPFDYLGLTWREISNNNLAKQYTG